MSDRGVPVDELLAKLGIIRAHADAVPGAPIEAGEDDHAADGMGLSSNDPPSEVIPVSRTPA